MGAGEVAAGSTAPEGEGKREREVGKSGGSRE